MRGPRLSATELLAVIQPWATVAEALHRRVQQLAEPTRATETLWIGCGSGRSVLWWAERVGARIEGVDPDPVALAEAEDAARAAGLERRTTFQHANPADLPHRPGVFDLVVIRMLQCGLTPGEAVMRQAAEVVRKGGIVIAMVPTWFNPPGARDAARMASLGILPRTLVQWKAACRNANLVDLAVEEAGADASWLDRGRLSPLVRGWRVAGTRGVTTALGPDFRALRRLARTRRLGLSFIRGVRWPHA